jgi:hypothetical protein
MMNMFLLQKNSLEEERKVLVGAGPTFWKDPS